MPKSKEQDGDAAFERFDKLFREVISVSNKAVREKMEAEKRARRSRRKKHPKK